MEPHVLEYEPPRPDATYEELLDHQMSWALRMDMRSWMAEKRAPIPVCWHRVLKLARANCWVPVESRPGYRVYQEILAVDALCVLFAQLSRTPEESTADEVPEHWRSEFRVVRRVPGRGLCGIQRFIFTCGLLTDLKFYEMENDYTARYCYPNEREALRALQAWDGTGDPPGPWIKEKVSGRAGTPRSGPRAC